MSALYEIRARYNKETITVYQAYKKEIALPAVANQRFEAPFSFHRMTWIKPSFLWLMARSQWGTKSGQEHILAIHIQRAAWEDALAQAVLTSPEKELHRDGQAWDEQFSKALVHVQWDPERDLRGNKLNHRSIQVGISRHLIQEYVENWIVSIEDQTPLVRKIHGLCKTGDYKRAQSLLPNERTYPISQEIQRRICRDIR
ncbi:MAG: DUF4291 domain-containing protein [Myxococcales bacterium]|nr:DUF4291 domain-containing protein [Myxococcales bacterium]MCB9642304.1 DUF4291 domain-containing protein [Myxococcales bacterium]